MRLYLFLSHNIPSFMNRKRFEVEKLASFSLINPLKTFSPLNSIEHASRSSSNRLLLLLNKLELRDEFGFFYGSSIHTNPFHAVPEDVEMEDIIIMLTTVGM